MGIGGSIFLIAVGAITAFGVNVQVGWLDLSVVGWVLMLAGLVGLLLTLYSWRAARRRDAGLARPVDLEPRPVDLEPRAVDEAPRLTTRRPADPGVDVGAADRPPSVGGANRVPPRGRSS